LLVAGFRALDGVEGRVATPEFPVVLPTPLCSSKLSFKLTDFVTKPLLEDLLALARIQSGDCSAFLIQWNMVARDVFAFTGLGNILHKNAFTARMSTQRIAEI